MGMWFDLFRTEDSDQRVLSFLLHFYRILQDLWTDKKRDEEDLTSVCPTCFMQYIVRLCTNRREATSSVFNHSQHFIFCSMVFTWVLWGSESFIHLLDGAHHFPEFWCCYGWCGCGCNGGRKGSWRKVFCSRSSSCFSCKNVAKFDWISWLRVSSFAFEKKELCFTTLVSLWCWHISCCKILIFQWTKISWKFLWTGLQWVFQFEATSWLDIWHMALIVVLIVQSIQEICSHSHGWLWHLVVFWAV